MKVRKAIHGGGLQAETTASTVEPSRGIEGGSWLLPSGRALAEFVLEGGFLAPKLWNQQAAGLETGSARVAAKRRGVRGRDKW